MSLRVSLIMREKEREREREKRKRDKCTDIAREGWSDLDRR